MEFLTNDKLLIVGAGNAGYRPYDATRRGDVLPRPRRDRAYRRMGREDRKSTRLNSSHSGKSRMPSSA